MFWVAVCIVFVICFVFVLVVCFGCASPCLFSVSLSCASLHVCACVASFSFVFVFAFAVGNVLMSVCWFWVHHAHARDAWHCHVRVCGCRAFFRVFVCCCCTLCSYLLYVFFVCSSRVMFVVVFVFAFIISIVFVCRDPYVFLLNLTTTTTATTRKQKYIHILVRTQARKENEKRKTKPQPPRVWGSRTFSLLSIDAALRAKYVLKGEEESSRAKVMPPVAFYSWVSQQLVPTGINVARWPLNVARWPPERRVTDCGDVTTPALPSIRGCSVHTLCKNVFQRQFRHWGPSMCSMAVWRLWGPRMCSMAV